MRIIEAISSPGKEQNEDIYTYLDDQYVVVMDGATGLGESLKLGIKEQWTDTQWFVQRVAKGFSQLWNPEKPLLALLEDVLASLQLNTQHDVIRLPSASAFFMKRTGDFWELFSIGDLCIIMRGPLGFELLRDHRVERLDDEVLKLIQQLCSSRGITVQEALREEDLVQCLRSNRLKRNNPEYEDAYYALDAKAGSIRYGTYMRFDEDKYEQILVCSDGASAYWDKYHLAASSEAFFNDVVVLGGQQILERLRLIETQDPDMTSYPRFKQSDDATIVRLEF